MSLKRLIILICATIVLSCCEKQQDGLYLSLPTDEEVLSFASSGGIQNVSITSSGSWVASPTPEWVVLGYTSGEANTSGQSVFIHVNPNSGKARSTVITFSSGHFSASVVVNQEGSENGEGPDDPSGGGGGGDETPDTDYANAPELTITAFVSAAQTEKYYKLTGIVSSFNPNTFEMTLTDDTASIYVYDIVNKTDWENKIFNNGIITLAGKYHYYAGKRIDEVVDAYILSFIPAGSTNDPIPVTMAEFKAAPVSDSQPYQLAGRISNIINTVYGNFDLSDNTGTAFVYGLTAVNLGYGTANDKSFSSLHLKEGDEIIIVGFRSEYNGQIEAKYSYFIEKTGSSGPGDDPNPGNLEGEPTLTVDFRTPLSELPQSNSEGLTDGSYIWNGYPFTLHATNKFYQGRNGNVYYLLIGKQGSYIQLPVIAGKALYGVRFQTAPQASENVIIDIARTDGTRMMINDSKLKKNTEYAWEIPGDEGVAYEILIATDYNAQFEYISLYYK